MTFIHRLTALCLVLALAVTMCACYQTPGATITDASSTTTTESKTVPTFPAAEGQLTLALLMGIMRSDMKWSQIGSYTHTDVDDSHATFAVADNYGKECLLSVTYDAATDVISEATLSYEDVSVDVLSDNTLVIRTIMVAMNEE